MRLKGWSDVMASGAVSIGGGIAVKQIDEVAGDAFMLTGLGMTADENCQRKNHQETKTAVLQKRYQYDTCQREGAQNRI